MPHQIPKKKEHAILGEQSAVSNGDVGMLKLLLLCTLLAPKSPVCLFMLSGVTLFISSILLSFG